MTKKSHDGDVEFIRALAELLTSNDLTELEVKREYGEDDSLNVRVSRAALAQPAVQMAPAPVPFAVQAAPAPATAAATAPSSAPSAPQGDDPASLPGAVTSPMV
ncbi:MAG: acetyl-CoA carboxylase, biotin carboxyl carrier protein, partial [Pseudomonadota bacterium]